MSERNYFCIQRLYDEVEEYVPDRSFLSNPHTMSGTALINYVIHTKYSPEQQQLIDLAMNEGWSFEVHGAYTSHISDLMSLRKLRPTKSAYRVATREKNYNKYRPIVISAKSESSQNVLGIYVSPSLEYVDQYSQVLLGYCAFSSKLNRFDLSRIENRQFTVFHYPKLYSEISSWSGLDEVLKANLICGDIVVMGHVDEFVESAQQMGFNQVEQVRIDGTSARDFGDLIVLKSTQHMRRIVCLSITHSFWGSASGYIGESLSQHGCRDIVYISKCGTFIDKELVHSLICPTYFHLWDMRSGPHEISRLTPPIQTRSEMRERFPHFIKDHLSGIHLTVPTVMGETFEQYEDYRKLHPASIDNEDGYIARNLERYNKGKTANAECHFTAFHFITDYLITKQYREQERSDFDLGRVSDIERNYVRDKQAESFTFASQAVCLYAQNRSIDRDPVGGFREKQKRPLVSPYIIGRAIELANIRAHIRARKISPHTTPGGLLIYGPPGIGKTKIGAAIFQECCDSGLLSVWIDFKENIVKEKSISGDTIALDIIYQLKGGVDKKMAAANSTFRDKLSVIKDYCDKHALFIVFDNVESAIIGQIDDGIRSLIDYHQLLIEVLSESKNAILLLLSREALTGMPPTAMKMERLSGMMLPDFVHLLSSFDISANKTLVKRVWRFVAGNPKAGQLIASAAVKKDENGVIAIDEKIFELEAGNLSSIFDLTIGHLTLDQRDLLIRTAAFNPNFLPIRREGIYALQDEDTVSRLKVLEEYCLIEPGEGFNEIVIVPLLQQKLNHWFVEDEVRKRDALRRAFRFYANTKKEPPEQWSSVSDSGALLGEAQTGFEAGFVTEAVKIWCSKDVRRSLVRWGEYRNISEIYMQVVKVDVSMGRKVGRTVPGFKAIAFNMLGISARNMGHYSSAIEFYRKGLSLCRGKIGVRWRAIILGNLSYAYIDVDLIDEGLKHAEKAVIVSKRIVKGLSMDSAPEEWRALAYAYGNRGVNNLLNGNLDAASSDLKEDLKLSEELGGNLEGIATAKGYLGIIEVLRGEVRSGSANLAQGLSVLFRLHNILGEETLVRRALNEWVKWPKNIVVGLAGRHIALLNESYQFELANKTQRYYENQDIRISQLSEEEYMKFLLDMCGTNKECKAQVDDNLKM